MHCCLLRTVNSCCLSIWIHMCGSQYGIWLMIHVLPSKLSWKWNHYLILYRYRARAALEKKRVQSKWVKVLTSAFRTLSSLESAQPCHNTNQTQQISYAVFVSFSLKVCQCLKSELSSETAWAESVHRLRPCRRHNRTRSDTLSECQ